MDLLPLEITAVGVILPVQAQPGARRNAIVGVHAGRLKVAVTQVAERGKANAAVVECLAEALGLKTSQVTLLSGPKNAQKRFLVTGVTADVLSARIEEVLRGD
jgi:uncharacterized protein (TIGR00251 family)